MKRMISGIKPTGKLTLGNYIGALKQFINVLEMQQISYDEIITTVKKENKTVARATWLVEISIPQGNENGGT